MSSPCSPSPPQNSLSTRYRSFCSSNPGSNDVYLYPHSPHDRSDHRPCIHDHIPDHNNINVNMAAGANGRSSSEMESTFKCCCGRNDCAYLHHNNVALEGLERDLEKAAKLGQALLSRHESYVAETQLENDRLSAKIAALETERSTLQNANERIVAENRNLLTKLDTINKSYTESDATVKNLEALLKDTELEVRRLNALARRAEELEARVHDMDRERTQISQKLNDSEQEGKSALTRWRESEKRLRMLEMELEKIEWEAKREMEKHEEVVARLERERILERELGGAEGRLKGAAALQGIQSGQNDNVVSHFVRDILQDNATLQAGIVELRELLQSSNEEVQNLREQIMQHRPVDADDDHENASARALDEQMMWDQPSPSDVQREVHVHHHYHAKLAAKGSRTPTVRKRAVRRTMMPGSLSTPDSSIPSTPVSRPKRYATSPGIPLALHQPIPRKNNRWSVQSATTMSSNLSSLPSSPRSYFDRYSSIFDRIEPGEESSRPTSPESVSVVSSPNHMLSSKDILPRLDPVDAIPEDTIQTFESALNTPPFVIQEDETTPATILHRKPSQDLTPKPSQILVPIPSDPINILSSSESPVSISLIPSPQAEPLAPETQSIPEHQIPDHDSPSPATSPCPDDMKAQCPSRSATPMNKASSSEEDSTFSSSPLGIAIRPSLHRSSSHDSLISISGMDIHIARHGSPPSFSRSYFTPSHLPTTTLNTLTSTSKQPLTAVASVAASASQFQTLTSTRGHGEGRRVLEKVAGSPAANPHRHASQPTSATSPGGIGGGGVAGRLGGWVRSRWGVAPTKSNGDLRSASASQASPGKRPTLATLLEAPPPPPLETLSNEPQRAATESELSAKLQPAAPEQSSPPRQIPPTTTTHNRTDSILTTSTSSTDTRRGDGGGRGPAGSLPASMLLRMPGINQKGPIPGFWIPQRAPSQVEVDAGKVQWEGLRDALG